MWGVGCACASEEITNGRMRVPPACIDQGQGIMIVMHPITVDSDGRISTDLIISGYRASRIQSHGKRSLLGAFRGPRAGRNAREARGGHDRAGVVHNFNVHTGIHIQHIHIHTKHVMLGA